MTEVYFVTRQGILIIFLFKRKSFDKLQWTLPQIPRKWLRQLIKAAVHSLIFLSARSFLTWGNNAQLIGPSSLWWWSLHRYDEQTMSGSRGEAKEWVTSASQANHSLSRSVWETGYRLNHPQAELMVNPVSVGPYLYIHLPRPSTIFGVLPSHNPVLL